MLSEHAPQPATILLVDDHPIVRLGFATLLRQADATLVFQEASNAGEALDLAACQASSIALVDLSLAGTLSLELIKQLRAVAPAMAILVVSMHDERLYAERALRAGARGYVMKQVAAQSIADAVHTIKKGGIWLSDAVRNDIISRVAMPALQGGGLGSLSDREVAVLRYISQGLKKGDIAKRMNLSPHTVETYRTNLKQKLGIPNGAELYRFAFLQGWEGQLDAIHDRR